MKTEESFADLSETGVQFVIYKAQGDCYCKTEVGTIFEEPDPTHKACIGTGITRRLILTPKLRYKYSGVTNASNIEQQKFERIKNFYATIYFPHNFILTTSDIVAFLQIDESNEVIKPYKPLFFTKVISVDPFHFKDFKYFAVRVMKINFAPYAEVIELE